MLLSASAALEASAGPMWDSVGLELELEGGCLLPFTVEWGLGAVEFRPVIGYAPAGATVARISHARVVVVAELPSGLPRHQIRVRAIHLKVQVHGVALGCPGHNQVRVQVKADPVAQPLVKVVGRAIHQVLEHARAAVLEELVGNRGAAVRGNDALLLVQDGDPRPALAALLEGQRDALAGGRGIHDGVRSRALEAARARRRAQRGRQ